MLSKRVGAEPSQIYKTHWDFLLQESKWLATDYYEERKWKVNVAKNLSNLCSKQIELKERHQVAKKMSNMCSIFWLSLMKENHQVNLPKEYNEQTNVPNPLLKKKLLIRCQQFINIEIQQRLQSKRPPSHRNHSTPPKKKSLTTLYKDITSYERGRKNLFHIPVYPVAPLHTITTKDNEGGTLRTIQNFQQARSSWTQIELQFHQALGSLIIPCTFHPPDPTQSVLYTPLESICDAEDSLIRLPVKLNDLRESHALQISARTIVMSRHWTPIGPSLVDMHRGGSVASFSPEEDKALMRAYYIAASYDLQEISQTYLAYACLELSMEIRWKVRLMYEVHKRLTELSGTAPFLSVGDKASAVRLSMREALGRLKGARDIRNANRKGRESRVGETEYKESEKGRDEDKSRGKAVREGRRGSSGDRGEEGDRSSVRGQKDMEGEQRVEGEKLKQEEEKGGDREGETMMKGKGRGRGVGGGGKDRERATQRGGQKGGESEVKQGAIYSKCSLSPLRDPFYLEDEEIERVAERIREKPLQLNRRERWRELQREMEVGKSETMTFQGRRLEFVSKRKTPMNPSMKIQSPSEIPKSAGESTGAINPFHAANNAIGSYPIISRITLANNMGVANTSNDFYNSMASTPLSSAYDYCYIYSNLTNTTTSSIRNVIENICSTTGSDNSDAISKLSNATLTYYNTATFDSSNIPHITIGGPGILGLSRSSVGGTTSSSYRSLNQSTSLDVSSVSANASAPSLNISTSSPTGNYSDTEYILGGSLKDYKEYVEGLCSYTSGHVQRQVSSPMNPLLSSEASLGISSRIPAAIHKKKRLRRMTMSTNTSCGEDAITNIRADDSNDWATSSGKGEGDSTKGKWDTRNDKRYHNMIDWILFPSSLHFLRYHHLLNRRKSLGDFFSYYKKGDDSTKMQITLHVVRYLLLCSSNNVLDTLFPNNISSTDSISPDKNQNVVVRNVEKLRGRGEGKKIMRDKEEKEIKEELDETTSERYRKNRRTKANLLDTTYRFPSASLQDKINLSIEYLYHLISQNNSSTVIRILKQLESALANTIEENLKISHTQGRQNIAAYDFVNDKSVAWTTVAEIRKHIKSVLNFSPYQNLIIPTERKASKKLKLRE